MHIPLYTQGLNECILVTIQNILRARYKIIFNDKQHDKLIKDAKASGLWSETSGGKFDLLYNWFTGRFKEEYGVNITVDSYDISSDLFEVAYKKGIGFGIGLMYAGGWIQRVRDGGEITWEEIVDSRIDREKYMGHNQFWKLDYIVGILRSIPYDEKFIIFKLNVLREAVKKGFYRPIARTLRIEDPLLDYYLVEMNKGTKFEKVEQLDNNNRKKLDLALRLRIIRE